MDTLTLPEEGWALAYPSPHYDVAHLVHTPCGWRSPERQVPEFWRQDPHMREHQCRGGGRDARRS